MSNFIKKYGKNFVFDIDFEKDFISLKDLFEEYGDNVYVLKGLYINTKGMYEDSPVFETVEYLVNIPSHMTDTCKDILSDEEAIEEIKSGKVGFTIHQYEKTVKGKKRICYTIDFKELDND